MPKPGFSTIIAAFAALLLAGAPAGADSSPTADKMVVDKSDRTVYLLRGGEVWKSYPMGLGFTPGGHKQREGDGRTPEGDYVLDWRNPKSQFYLSIHISYPDARDKASARERSVPPGGDIFIHGYPGYSGGPMRDWTLGCIAVSNAAMDEIWKAVPNGTPITIRP